MRSAVAVAGSTAGTTGISSVSPPVRAGTVEAVATGPVARASGRTGRPVRTGPAATVRAAFGGAFGAAFGAALGAAFGAVVGAASGAGSLRGRRTGWVGRGVTARSSP